MKAKRKVLALSICAVLLVAVSVLGTTAYLTSQDRVTNTFTVGEVNITLDEADVKPDGTYEVDETVRVKSNEYKLIPGHTYIKDPTVTVTKGSEESYVRMLVTINKANELKAILGEDFLPQNYVTGWDSDVWPCVAAKDNGDNTITYEFRYKDTVDASEATEDIVMEALFETFTLPGEVTGEELATIAPDENDENGFKIEVVGHAIQADGFENADAAWAAFEEQVNTNK